MSRRFLRKQYVEGCSKQCWTWYEFPRGAKRKSLIFTGSARARTFKRRQKSKNACLSWSVINLMPCLQQQFPEKLYRRCSGGHSISVYCRRSYGSFILELIDYLHTSDSNRTHPSCQSLNLLRLIIKDFFGSSLEWSKLVPLSWSDSMLFSSLPYRWVTNASYLPPGIVARSIIVWWAFHLFTQK